MPSQDINIKVNAQNAASPTLKRVQQDIVGLDKAAGTAAGGIGAMGKAFAGGWYRCLWCAGCRCNA
jgi:hypothetical protein